MQNYQIFMTDFLGQGTFGSVFGGVQKSTGRPCAFKIISQIQSQWEIQNQKNQLLNEIQILKTLKSQNIVQIYNVVKWKNNIYIIQQLCDSDLYKKINSSIISQVQAIRILTQIVNGYLVLVKQGIIHRDLKPANILLKNNKVKIADFGTAKKGVSKNMMNKTKLGTPYYMSSELLNKQAYSSKCDVWAVGVIFYQMLHNGKMPWIANDQQELYSNIQMKPLKINPSLSQDTKLFLKRVLQVKQKNRASWDEVFDHPIFKGKFQKYFQNNKHIQNKLKMAINQLRYIINSAGTNLYNFMHQNNICSLQTEQLNIIQFKKLLLKSNIQLTEQQIRHGFDDLDSDKKGSISIEQINFVINKKLKQTIQSKLKFTMKGIEVDEQERQKIIKKISQFFINWHGILKYRGIKLSKLFKSYCGNNNGSMSFQNFKKMMKNQFNQVELQFIFKQIDIDHSNTIEFNELRSYYCRFNKLTEQSIQE